jgi:excisionase family DNA binding protein
LLASPRLHALLEWLLGQGDVILMDSPPVLRLPDAAILATLAEGTILVVGAGVTRRESLQQAKDRLLRPSGTHLLGLVMNRVKPRPGSYYYGPALKGAGTLFWPHVLGRRGKVGDGAWLTLGEAAEWLGVSKEMARQWCKSGRLPAVRRMLGWQVERSELERLVQE